MEQSQTQPLGSSAHRVGDAILFSLGLLKCPFQGKIGENRDIPHSPVWNVLWPGKAGIAEGDPSTEEGIRSGDPYSKEELLPEYL